ncbi:hypothetical protein K1719_027659 [Acacia pycnantha]|nr:hypothetical protein K1719_027659 [Acacia pycnantha]
MEDATSSWVEQLPYVLWGYRTSIQTATRETPFRIRALQNEEENSAAIFVELDLVDEVRIATHCRDLVAKQFISTRYNKKVRPQSFEKGGLVLRRADIGNKNARECKLASNWEGPYRIMENLGKGAYKLKTLKKKVVKQTWNADKLKACYS